MRIARSTLLTALQAVLPGISTVRQAGSRQSFCFCFQDQAVATFSETTACRIPIELDLNVAVPAVPLVNLLKGLPEQELEVTHRGREVRIQGRGRRAGIAHEGPPRVPQVEIPKWTPLPDGFTTALDLCRHTTGRGDVSEYLQLAPAWVEATDNNQVLRYQIPTGLSEAVLLHRDAVKPLLKLKPGGIAFDSSWIHFGCPDGLVYSSRRFHARFPDCSRLLEPKGKPLRMPEGLTPILKSFGREETPLRIDIQPGRYRLQARLESSWYRQQGRLDYSGPPLGFLIAPRLLLGLLARSHDFLVAPGRLMVVTEDYRYVGSLGKPHDAPYPNQKHEPRRRHVGSAAN